MCLYGYCANSYYCGLDRQKGTASDTAQDNLLQFKTYQYPKFAIVDKIALVFVALIVASLGFGSIFFLKDYLSLSDGWTLFVIGSFAYAVAVIYGVFTCTTLRTSSHKVVLMFALLVHIAVAPIGFLLLFRYGILPQPDNLFPYMVGGITLAPLTIISFEYCLKWRRK